MEQLLKRIYMKEQVVDIVENTHFFVNPKIDFILSKEINNKETFIIGVTENNNLDERFIIRSNKKKKIINSADINYKTDLDECIEGYIIFCLCNGYEVKYVSLFMHIDIWNYLETYLGELNTVINGVRKYLYFCERIGLTVALINYYSDTVHQDMYGIYTNGMFENYDILLTQYISNERLILGYQNEISNIIYLVMILDKDTNKVEYKEYHSQINSAMNDFIKQFYDLSITYYKQRERDIHETAEHFIQFLEEQNNE